MANENQNTGERKVCFSLLHKRSAEVLVQGWRRGFIYSSGILSFRVLPWPKIATQFWPQLCIPASEEAGKKHRHSFRKDLDIIPHELVTWTHLAARETGEGLARWSSGLDSKFLMQKTEV